MARSNNEFHAPAASREIIVTGAREHNLRNVDLRIPKHALTVFTGVSGSGKSSLAFDTLYAEGQRRYVESLSSYARQFLGQMEKPKVDKIRGLSPTIAIEQKATSNNPRSTVGTVTEIYDYLRVLYARLGHQHCPQCGKLASGQTTSQIVDALAALPEGTRVVLAAPLVRQRKGEHRELFESAKQRGFTRLLVDARAIDLGVDEIPALDKKSKHDILLVVDRVVIKASERARLTDSVELTLKEGQGVLIARHAPSKAAPEEERVFSKDRACHGCGLSFGELAPLSFSFNSPIGACTACNGLGTRPEMDPDLLVPNHELSIREGAVAPWAAALSRAEGWKAETVTWVLEQLKVNLDTPWRKLSPDMQRGVLFGEKKGKQVWEGLVPQMMRRYRASSSDMMKEWYNRFLSERPCLDCHGARLKADSLAVRVAGESLGTVVQWPVRRAHEWISALPLSGTDKTISAELVKEIAGRLGFLLDVGLDYLTLARMAGSLSGGESQRIRLASQIGSELTGVLYVLDEPSIGLHQRDNERLLGTLLRLRDLGNTVLVVEHDEDTIRAADYVVDFGPGAGVLGGEIVAAGSVENLLAAPRSVTGAFLSGRRAIPVPSTRRSGNGKQLRVEGAREHNLQNLTVAIPLGTLTAITGVSGAGKSTLVNRILLPALQRHLYDAKSTPGAHDRIVGLEHIDKVIAIDQQPIGRTPRSNPATYTKLFDSIRALFAQTPEARAYGYDQGRFSFNVKGGRCEACGGDGLRKVEMHFLPDVYVTCGECKGKRFNEATLRVTYRGKTIADILDTSVAEALELFSVHREIKRALQTLDDVGLSYMKLGQPSPTLSGGEAQRIKLARELSKVGTGTTLYVLDEPTTGLHFADVERLLQVLGRLVDAGNSVLVVEHNLDVIKVADHVIDMGPEGGERGGLILAEGTPELVARSKASATGRFLAPLLRTPKNSTPPARKRAS